MQAAPRLFDRYPLRRVALLISALATVLVAAGFDRDANLARLASMPRERRQALLDNLRKFDLVLTPEKRQAVLRIDQGIQGLEPDERVTYQAVLRRFHNWLESLPEGQRDLILDQPANERMAEIKKLLVNYPVPRVDTPRFLRIAEVGEFSPFELASIYRIWETMTPAERKSVEQIPVSSRRMESLFKRGELKNIARETTPADYDEVQWTARTEAQLKKSRVGFLLEELRKKADKGDARRAEIVRRQSMNFFLVNRRHDAVTPERLEQFAAAFPSWIQPSFDSFPPDEARRWLAVVYRLVYPAPAEIKPPTGPGAKAPGQGKPAATKGSPPGPTPKKPGTAAPF